MRLAVLFCFIFAVATLQAQESPTPASSLSPSAAPARRVSLSFALPPLEGTISLGIYNQTGKLVRVLHREDTISDFTAGHDALETEWDGTDDTGNPLPNGKYSARGYVVGDLKVEGVDYFFNDWVTDENSPHIRHLSQLWREGGDLRVTGGLADGKKASFICDQSTGAIAKEVPAQFGIHCDEIPKLPNLVSPRDCAVGRDGTTWFIDSAEGSGLREVKQLSKTHDLLRQLSYPADEPQPESIEASPSEEKIFLIEQNDRLQRLRALSLVRTTTENGDEAVSDWKTHFEKKIIAHQNFALENGKPVAASAGPQTQLGKVAQKLRSDPLRKNEPGKAELAVGIDPDGSFLETSDGLPLRTISDTPNLSRALLARPNDDAIDIFQDDGAVVEQFRVSNLAQMIAFDCGDFELK
ncbi:MAG: FlgD immunoglobulin-like domain containing protein [Chthoniobacterales bacterium]